MADSRAGSRKIKMYLDHLIFPSKGRKCSENKRVGLVKGTQEATGN